MDVLFLLKAAQALCGVYSSVQKQRPCEAQEQQPRRQRAELDKIMWKPLHPAMRERACMCWLKDAQGSFVVSRTNDAVALALRKVWVLSPRTDK